MTSIENYCRHVDVVDAVKDVLGIPRDVSLTQSFSSYSASDFLSGKAKPAKAHAEDGHATLTQEFICLERELVQFCKSDDAHFSRFMSKLEKKLQGNPAALDLVHAILV